MHMSLEFDRRRLLAAGAACTALPLATSPRAQTPQASDSALLNGALSQTGAPAVAAMAFTPDKVLFLEAASRRRVDRPQPVTIDDLWHIGSNTKSMTSTVYARLVETRRAKWGAKVAELFPDLAISTAWRDTTVEDLMRHRAGVVDGAVMDAAWATARYKDPAAMPIQRMMLAARVFGMPPAGKPGGFEYANANYIILGAAIERICGAAWEEVIRTELFAPLGMASAGFGAPLGAQPWGHIEKSGKPAPVEPQGPMAADNPQIFGPAGRVHLALADYVKYLRLFLTEGGGVLTPDSVARLTAPATAEAASYGLGWGVVRDIPWAKGPLITHNGSNTMWFCSAHLSPARGMGMAIVSNDGKAGEKAVQAVARELMIRFAPT